MGGQKGCSVYLARWKQCQHERYDASKLDKPNTDLTYARQPEPKKQPQDVGGVRLHGPECNCWMCADDSL